jgi:hypothetical protein
MKRLLRFSTFFVLIVLLFGCASTQVHQVYVRDDVEAASDNLLVMPLFGTKISGNSLTLADNKDASVPSADAALLKQFKSRNEGKVVTVPKSVFDKVDGSYKAIDVLIGILDQASMEEQSGMNPDKATLEILKAIAKAAGGGNMAFAIVYPTEEVFESGAVKDVRVHIGLFHLEKETWKWITKATTSSGLLPEKYPMLVNSTISKSFEKLDEDM